MHPKSQTLLGCIFFVEKKRQKFKSYSSEFKLCGIM